MALQNRRKLKLQLTAAACILVVFLVQVKPEDSRGSGVNQSTETKKSERSGTKKKELKDDVPVPNPVAIEVVNSTAMNTDMHQLKKTKGVLEIEKQQEKRVVVSEKTLSELQADAQNKKEKPQSSSATVAGALPQDLSAVAQMNMNDSEIPNSFQNGFILLLGLSTAFTIFIALRIYKLRLSRAERKYGVQGDRSTQELTPLPIAIEDCSDDDDQTLFDIQRQQIRIL